MSIPNLSLAKEMAYTAYQQGPALNAAPASAESKFQVRTDGSSITSQGTQTVGAVDKAAGAAEPSAVEPSKGATKLSELLDASKTQDPVRIMELVRGVLSQAVDGGPGAISMKELIAVQLLAQDATRTLELTTKVAEHATSGVKTVLQTQA